MVSPEDAHAGMSRAERASKVHVNARRTPGLRRSRGGLSQRHHHDKAGTTMWNLISCYLSGRHDYHVRCAPGAIFLACTHCGKRSMGWELRAQEPIAARIPVSSGPHHLSTHAHSR